MADATPIETDELATQPMAALPGLGAEGELCTHCSAPLNADQRYCLNCGRRRARMRLPFLDIVEADARNGAIAPGVSAPAAAAMPVERSPLIALASLIALLLALGIGVLIGRGSSGSERAATPPVVTVQNGPAGAATAPAAFATSDWPTGTDGFTVQLQTLPATATAADVTAAKQDATTKGAASVGALKGADFPSVGDPGIVIYSGVYTTKKQAASALKGLLASFPGAKLVHVSTVASGATSSGGSGGKDPSAATLPKSTGTLSPQDYQKRSKKLPDKVQSQGTPPAKDNKAPGGGSSATKIG